MIEGESLVDICADPKMPSRATVYRWQREMPDFETQCACAREGLADYQDHLIARLIDNCTPETANADKVKLSGLQWRAAKLAPKKYGDRLVNEHTGKDGAPLTVKIMNYGEPVE